MDAAHGRFYVSACLHGPRRLGGRVFGEQRAVQAEEIPDDEYRRVEGRRFRFRPWLSGRHDAVSREPVDRICPRRQLPFPLSWLDARSDALRRSATDDEAKRIEFQSDIANFDNSFKVYDGGAMRLRLPTSSRNARRKKPVRRWIDANPERRENTAPFWLTSPRFGRIEQLRETRHARSPHARPQRCRVPSIYTAVSREQMTQRQRTQAKLAETRKAIADANRSTNAR